MGFSWVFVTWKLVLKKHQRVWNISLIIFPCNLYTAILIILVLYENFIYFFVDFSGIIFYSFKLFVSNLALKFYNNKRKRTESLTMLSLILSAVYSQNMHTHNTRHITVTHVVDVKVSQLTNRSAWFKKKCKRNLGEKRKETLVLSDGLTCPGIQRS